MLNALLNVLNGCTDIPFAEIAWTHSPDDKYGVITLGNQLALDADADPVSEKMLTGFVDVFIRKPKNLSTVSDVESAMKRLGIWFAMNSVQFEDDAGYVHYEWIWRDATRVVNKTLSVAKFHTIYGYSEPQIISPQMTPQPPAVSPYTKNGLVYSFYEWNPSVHAGYAKNTVFEAVYKVDVTIKSASGVLTAWNGDNAFTESQIADMVEFFANGGVVKASASNGNAVEVTTEHIKYPISATVTRTATWGV